jgi:serine/threonine protein kinase
VLKKASITINQLEHIRAERNILAATDCPFVVRLFYSFQSEEYLFLVMEYLPGGDLHALLKILGCFSEPMARMYAAEVVLALEYLHARGIVHRDLKVPARSAKRVIHRQAQA